ncbi:MAG: ribonuclease III [Beijerinckiaceae bacterium]
MPRKAPQDLTPLEARIGHRFLNIGLLRLALTHVSATGKRVDSYQRLEFLGDRVLGLVVADMLYEKFPDAPEGDLSRRLAELVRRETCVEIALEWDVAPLIRLGEGEAQSGGSNKAAILGDICESILGAVYLDGGFAAAAALVRRSFGARISQETPATRDPKSALQEWAQGRGLATPAYRLEERTGPDHQPRFRIAAVVAGFDPATGEGSSKRHAEQAAAEAFLARENIIPAVKGAS